MTSHKTLVLLYPRCAASATAFVTLPFSARAQSSCSLDNDATAGYRTVDAGHLLNTHPRKLL